MTKPRKNILQAYRESKKSSVTVYIVLRVLVIACMIGQLLRGDLNNAFLCLLSLVLFTLPIIIKDRLKIELPNALEIIIFLFIFAAEILGEIYNFYGNIPNWDTMLHTINGFLFAAIGFALVELLNENSKKIKLSPLYVAIVAFCFSMAIGVCWEFFEYSADKVFLLDMQKDSIVSTVSTVTLDPEQKNKTVVIKNIDKTIMYDSDGNALAVIDGGYLDIGINDTMKDLFVNLIGAVTFSVIGYFYIKNKDKYKFAAHFIPRKSEEKKEKEKSTQKV